MILNTIPTPTFGPTCKKILYPFFSECSQYTVDPFWQQVFEECARGKFPRGSGINTEGDTVYFRNQNKGGNSSVFYKLKESPEESFQDLKRLFQEQLNFKSNQDRFENAVEVDDHCKDLQETFAGNWQTIKKKKIKDPIIRKYILYLKEHYNLDDKETAELAQMIKLGFLFNWIPNEEVIYEDQKIVDIKSLRFNPEERYFELDEPEVYYKREYKSQLSKLSQLWHKFLERPKNRYVL